MQPRPRDAAAFALTLASAWRQVENRLDRSLGAVRGISLAEYRLLRALADMPSGMASRVDLADAVGLTPSGVTRALRPLEKLGIVSSLKSKRDARLAVASLTPAGRELLNDASDIVAESMQVILGRCPKAGTKLPLFGNMLEEVARA